MRYGVAVIIIILFAIIGSIVLFGHGGNSGGKSATTPKLVRAADYADQESSTITWTMQGRIVGDDQFRSVRISITPHTRTIQLLDGYNETVEKQNDYANTPTAYETFTRALDLLSFGKQRLVKNTDDRGFCPLGSRFIYELTNGSDQVMRSWSDTCSTADGPFAGSAPIVAEVFENQVPGYSLFIESVQF